MSECKVVVINGVGTSGKDEFIKQVHKLENKYRLRVFNASSITPVKHACALLDCPANEKSDAARNFWSAVKDAWVQYNNGPFRNLKSIVDNILRFNMFESYIVFYHVREADEIKKIKEEYGDRCVKLLIRNPYIEAPGCSKDQLENIESISYDEVIENNGSLEKLYSDGEEFVKSIFKGDLQEIYRELVH